MNRLHEKDLRIVYKDYISTFKNLEIDRSVNIHQRNLQLLMVEIYKTKSNLNPSFMKKIYEEINWLTI